MKAIALTVALLGASGPLLALEDDELNLAIRRGDVDTVREMIGADPALLEPVAGARSAIEEAIHRERREIVRLLLDEGVSLGARDDYGRTPLHQAKSPAMARLLLEAGADPLARDDQGRTPLHTAVERECLAVVDVYREAGMELDLVNAISLGERQLALSLLEEDPSQALRSVGREYPLDLAAALGDAELVSHLLACGAGVNRLDREGYLAGGAAARRRAS